MKWRLAGEEVGSEGHAGEPVREHLQHRLLDNDVRRGQEDGDRSDHGEHCENDEAETVNDHGSEFPIADYFRLFVAFPHPTSNKLQFT